MSERWIYSDDEEHWTCSDGSPTRDEARLIGIFDLGLSDDDVIYTGRIVPLDMDGLAKYAAEHFVKFDLDELLSGWAYEIVGELANEWPNPLPQDREALVAMLQPVLRFWIARTCSPAFYAVKSVEAHKVTREDSEAAVAWVQESAYAAVTDEAA